WCRVNSVWDWQFAFEVLPAILHGLLVTIQATVLGSALAYVLGLVFALLRRSPIRLVSGGVWLFMEFVRSTPLLVQLFFLFYVLPLVGITLSPMVTGVIGLGLHYATYPAEVSR